MAVFFASELIARARTYVDDDHNDQSGWISDARWLNFLNTEIGMQYRRWLRMSLVKPKFFETAFTDVSTSLQTAAAIVGVAEDIGNGLRMLTPFQSAFGVNWDNSNDPINPLPASSSTALYWSAYASGQFGSSSSSLPDSEITVEVSPAIAANYVVRWLPRYTALVSAAADRVDLPEGTDERVVLGMAQRAGLKDSSASALLERLILAADTDVGFAAFSSMSGNSPRVRRVRPTVRHQFPTNPAVWQWFSR